MATVIVPANGTGTISSRSASGSPKTPDVPRLQGVLSPQRCSRASAATTCTGCTGDLRTDPSGKPEFQSRRRGRTTPAQTRRATARLGFTGFSGGKDTHLPSMMGRPSPRTRPPRCHRRITIAPKTAATRGLRTGKECPNGAPNAIPPSAGEPGGGEGSPRGKQHQIQRGRRRQLQ